MKRILYFLSKVLLFTALFNNSFAQEILVVTESFPPYNYVDKTTGEYTGLATEIIQAVLTETETSYKLVEYPWARAYRMAMTQPNVLIYSLKRTEERESIFKWVGELSAHQSHFIALKSSNIASFSSHEDLKSQHISVIRDGAIARSLQSDGFTNLDLSASREVIWRKIKMGRTKIWCTNLLSARYVIEQSGDDPDLIQILQPYTNSNDKPLYAAFSKSTDDKIVNMLREAFKKIKQNGVYQKILLKYSIDNND